MTLKQFTNLSIEKKHFYLTELAIQLRHFTRYTYATNLYKVEDFYVRFEYEFSPKNIEGLRTLNEINIRSNNLKHVEFDQLKKQSTTNIQIKYN
jgi:hypothetical protein